MRGSCLSLSGTSCRRLVFVVILHSLARLLQSLVRRGKTASLVCDEQLLMQMRNNQLLMNITSFAILEEFILEFIQRTGIENIAIHDLENLITLDQKTISGN